MGFNSIPCNPYPISTEELNKGNNDDLNARVLALEGDVSDLDSAKANKADIATEFSDLTNYNAGDLVYYEGALYEFQVDHTAGSWETSEVIQKDLSDIVNTLKSGLTNITNRYIVNSDSYVSSCDIPVNTYCALLGMLFINNVGPRVVAITLVENTITIVDLMTGQTPSYVSGSYSNGVLTLTFTSTATYTIAYATARSY